MANGISSCPFCGSALPRRNVALPGRAPRLVTMPCTCPQAVAQESDEERERIRDERARAFGAVWARSGIPEEFAHVEADFALAEAIDSNRSLYLTGENGRGKTRLACMVAKGFLLRHTTEEHGVVACRRSLRFVTWQDVTSQIRSARRSWTQSEVDVYQRLVGVSLLVLDDVGKGVPEERDAETLEWIVNQRWADHRPVVFTSQYDTEMLVARYAKAGSETLGALLSRIRGWCDGARLDGPDRRLTHGED